MILYIYIYIYHCLLLFIIVYYCLLSLIVTHATFSVASHFSSSLTSSWSSGRWSFVSSLTWLQHPGAVRASLVSLSLQLWSTCSRLHHLILLPSGYVRVVSILIPKSSESWRKLILTFQERTKPQGVQRHRPGLLENHPHEQCEPCDIETFSFLQSLNVTWIQVEYLTIHPDSKHAAKHPAEACGGMLRPCPRCQALSWAPNGQMMNWHHHAPSILHEITDMICID